MDNQQSKTFGISGFWLKVIAAILMTLDHVALLFISRGNGDIPTNYYILRAVGKMAFPIFAFMAVEGAYHSKNVPLYFLRLGFFALLLDAFGFSFGAINGLPVADNPMVGNAFMDMFMGVLLITLLRRKDTYSLFAIIPLAYEILSDLDTGTAWGTIFKSDWGTFAIVLFAMFFLARKITDSYLKNKALKEGLQEDTYLGEEPTRYYKITEAIALVITELVFYFIYRVNYTAFFIPNEFVPIGTFSTLAFICILLYNGKRGFHNKIIQYSFYAYYPLHLAILGIISMFCGVLANIHA
jgi:hypothetical protein